jgi:alkylation response protein AidB-like acyl-CoA dehydrogenase
VVFCGVEDRVLQLTRARLLASQGTRGATPLGSLQKLGQARINQRASSLLIDLLGPAGQVGFDYDCAEVTTPAQMQIIRARANSIEGGTDEIQRNIIGEQILGLPGDIRVDKDVPWNEVPHN